MAATWSKGVLRPLIFLNLILHAALLCLIATSIDKYIHRNLHHTLGGSILTVLLLIFSLIAGVLGLCSAVTGIVHVSAWRGDSLASAVSSGLFSWAMTAVAFGFVCKQIETRNNAGARVRALGAIIIILTVTQLMYLIMLHLGIKSSNYGVGYRSCCNAYGMMEDDQAPKDSTIVSRPDAV